VAELGLKLSPLAAGVLCLGVIEAAYATEIYRAGINAVHHGQREAALAIGMTSLEAMRHVVLPQAVRQVIPPLTNQCVGLLKTSAAVSLIALPDLTFEAQVVTGLTYQGLKVFGLAMLMYLALSLPVSWLARRLERRR
jgi:ABC-type amino acid transport system permease subunit